MSTQFTRSILPLSLAATSLLGLVVWSGQHNRVEASSHREAPLIADDPLADNTDLYAFRDPNDAEMINIIANYIPLELPQGGPNYNNFGENIRYEIHVKNGKNNDANDPNKDDITYRFTFTRTNEDPTTFFNIRNAGNGPKQNLKATYTLEMSTDGGASFTTLTSTGMVPPTNIGPRSIMGAAGLGAASYESLMTSAITSVGGMKVFCGPVDDPFFTDLGGVFDLGGIRAAAARDGLARKNTHTIAMQIPISMLQKTGQNGAAAANILDANYIIGVWASASRPAMKTLKADGTNPDYSGDWIQVSRLGMPLLNEVIQPIGSKDAWNAATPYTEAANTEDYLSNPELGLYMADGDGYFGAAVPGLAPLRIQRNSLGTYDFANSKNGVSALLGNAATAGTALARVADGGYGEYLLRAGKPRSVDILPIFHTGVPNLPPYQLNTGKPAGSPLSPGKPFVNNFLPLIDNVAQAAGVGGDMLRLNMAVPATPRNSADFSSEGLLYAAVLGLTDPRFNGDASLQSIPNMDGFPNGRRLEDDVTRIELQAVGGIVLYAIGLPYEDGAPGLAGALGFTVGIEKNDTTFKAQFPYEQTPWSGTKVQATVTAQRGATTLNLQPSPVSLVQNFPNPFVDQTTLHYEVGVKGPLTIIVSDMTGKQVATLVSNKLHKPGSYDYTWEPKSLSAGTYIATVYSGKTVLQSVKLVHNN